MKKTGKGIGCSFYGTGYGNGFPDVSRAVVQLEKDGSVTVFAGAAEVGQGAKTVLSQMAAEVMGLTMAQVHFICEDTDDVPDAGTAAASRQTYNTGNAVKRTAEKLLMKMKAAAADQWNIHEQDRITIDGDKLLHPDDPDVTLSYKEMAFLAGPEMLRAEDSFTAVTTRLDDETGQGNPYWPYTFNVYGIEVEVDTNTGKVRIIKAVCAQDVGRAVNPKLIEGQMDGGFAMGLGYVLMEDINLQQGKMKHDRYSSYLIPTAMDVPDLEKIIIESPESTAPYGAKGIGEPVMLGVAPAVLNAIYDAVGVRMTEIPVTPDKLLIAIREKEGVSL
ncbi:MAG: molybdopterin cofactor-binding domain-containing protein [Bacillota bacterium]|nr:molybdopterin cofactor-binding domain-containing protein [Bacillota bacterium]MDW7676388.1 molybdopterin cofactor-binding domain-containing protein [Bacillota bacterium]